MNLSIINECVADCNESVINELDMLYVKQQNIMEFSEELDLISKYQCFQEGYASPGSSPELDVFNFDNKHIINAIRHFNEAYALIPFDKTNFDEIKEKQERGELNIRSTMAPEIEYPDSLIKETESIFRDPSGPLEKGFQELQKQFDCKFNIYISRKTSTGTILTNFPNDIGRLTISKSKGFQLGGLPITINLNIPQLLGLVPSNKKLFGQSLSAVLLHEIYHNIVHMIGVRNKNLHNDIQKTMISLKDTKSFEGCKSTIMSFINRFTDKFSISDASIDKERVSKRLYVLSQIQENPGAVKKFEKDIKNNVDPTNTNNDIEIDRYIRSMEMVKDYVVFKRGLRIVSAACCILLAGLGFAFGSTIVAISGVIGLAIMSLSMLKKKVLSLFGLTPRIQEEYFCDLFASMYKLPIHLSSFNRQIKLNQMNAEKMKRLRELDQKIDKHVKDEHPLNFDRELTSYKIAKQYLASGRKLKPEERDYLEYIVNLHEGIEDIDNPYSKRQAKKLNPEAAADLQKTLHDFVEKTGASVTESFIDGGDDNGS